MSTGHGRPRPGHLGLLEREDSESSERVGALGGEAFH